MADRYWVGGSGTWDAASTTNWSATPGGASGASAPTTADNVFFDQVATYTVSAGTTRNCANLTVSAGTVTFTGSNPINIAGSMSLVSTTVWSASGAVNFTGAGGSYTITTNGVAIGSGAVNFTGAAGTYTLGSALTIPSTGGITFSNTTLNLNGFTLTTGSFNSYTSLARTINFGSSNIVLNHPNTGVTVLLIADATNFTWTGTGGFVAPMNVTRTFTFGTTGGTTARAVNLSLPSGSSTASFTTGSWFNKIDFTGSTCATGPAGSLVRVDTLTLDPGGTYTNLIPVFTRSQTWTSQFGLQLGGIGFDLVGGTLTLDNTQTYSATSAAHLINGTLDLGGADLTIGTFNSSYTSTRAINFGSNNIILSTTAAGASNLAMAIVTGFTWAGTGGFRAAADVTRSFTFGSTGGTATNAPNLTLTGSGTAVQTFTGWFNTLDFGTTAFTVGATTINLNNVILSTGGTFTSLPIYMRSTGSITSNGKTISELTIQHAGTTTLNDALTISATSVVTLLSGTLDLNNFTLTVGRFSSNVNTNLRSVNFGSANIVLNHTTAGQTVINLANANNFTWTGTGGFTASAAVTRTYSFGNTNGGSITTAPNLTLTGSGTAVQTFTSGSWFKTLDFGTTAFTIPTTSLNLINLTLSSGGTFTGLTPTILATGAINGNGKSIAGMTINHTGTTELLSALSTTGTGTVTLTNGTLKLNDFTLTTGIFSSTNSNTRSVNFGSGNIVLAHTTAAQTVLAMGTSTNFSWTGTGGFTAAASVTRSFAFGSSGGTSTSAPNLTLTGSGTAVQTFSGWFNTLDFGTTAFTIGTTNLNVNSIVLSTGGTFTALALTFPASGTINGNGKTIGAMTINHSGTTQLLSALSTVVSVSGTTGIVTLTSGTLDLNNFTLTTGRFSSGNSNTRSINFGTANIVLANTVQDGVNLTITTATNISYSGTGKFVADASVGRQFNGPISASTQTVYPNLTFTGTGTTPPILSGYFNTLDFGTTASTLTYSTVNVVNLILSSSGTYSGGLAPTMVGTGTITSNGKSLYSIDFNNDSGTTQLLDTLNVVGRARLLSGTLDLNGYDIYAYEFNTNNTNTRSVNFGTNNIIVQNPSSVGYALISMDNLTNFTWTGTTGGLVAPPFANAVSASINCGSTGGNINNAINLTFTGTGSANGPTIGNNSWFKKIDFGTTSFGYSGTSSNILRASVVILSPNGSSYTNLALYTHGTSTVTSNGKLISSFSVIDGTTTLLDALTLNATGLSTLTSGELNLNGFTLTTGRFSSNNSNTRSISFGTANIVLTTTTPAQVNIDMADATNFSYTGTGGFTTAMTATRTFTFGTSSGSISNAPNLSLTSGASIPTFTDGSWFKVLNFTGTTSTPAVSASSIGIYVDTLTLATGGTYTNLIPVFTRSQTWTRQFSKQLGGIGFNLTSGTLTLDNTQNYTTTSKCFLYSGTINLNNTNQSFASFSSTGVAPRSITSSGSIALTGNWTVTSGENFSTDPGTIIYMNGNTITGATFAGGNATYGILVQGTTYPITITGSNSFQDIQIGSDMIPAGQAEYTTPGTYSWTAPAGVTSVSVVAVGAGGSGGAGGTGGAHGGGGGGLGWKNNITVVPGQSYTVVVGAGGTGVSSSGSLDGNPGGNSYFNLSTTVAGLGGGAGSGGTSLTGYGGSYVGDGGGAGGNSGNIGVSWGGAGGAGGYSGAGGAGAPDNNAAGVAGTGGGGGGGGSTVSNGFAGGGVGIYGQGSNGAGGLGGTSATSGGGGSGGTDGVNAAFGAGGQFGGGGGGGRSTPSGAGGGGAVRIIWGLNRAFPSTNTVDTL